MNARRAWVRRASACTAALFGLVCAIAIPPVWAGFEKVAGGIEFTYSDPHAASVNLAGTFNNYDTAATPMTKDDDGVWRAVIDLDPGTYKYKFVVNGGDWISDPENPVTVGDYGDSEMIVTDAGEPAVREGVKAASNTALNSRVAMNGFFRSQFHTVSSRATSDRFRLNRPDYETNLDVSINISEELDAGLRLQLETQEGTIQEVTTEFYSGHIDFRGEGFDLTAFYNEEVASFDDPLEALGHRDLPGSQIEEHIAFGRGSQGLLAATRPYGVEITGVYSNVYDLDPFDENPVVYDNTDTDVLAARAKRDVGPVRLGATYSSTRDAWWTGFIDNSNPVIDDFRAERSLELGIPVDQTSDWYELDLTEELIGVDAGYEYASWLDMRAEYALWRWDGRFGVGNKERVDGTSRVNGEVDIPVGDDEGTVIKAILSGTASDVSWSLSHQVFDTDGMGADEEFVSRFTRSYAGTPVGSYVKLTSVDGFDVLRFGPLPAREDAVTELDLTYRGSPGPIGLHDWRLELEADYRGLHWTIFDTTSNTGSRRSVNDATRLGVRIHTEWMDEGRLTLGLDTEFIDNDNEPVAFDDNDPRLAPWNFLDTREFIGKASYRINPLFTGLLNVRWMDYRTVSATDVAAGDRTFVNPYLALIYSPRPAIEVRLGWGIDPLDYEDSPVEGRAYGRERWRAREMWAQPTLTPLGAEKLLEDENRITLMGVMSF